MPPTRSQDEDAHTRDGSTSDIAHDTHADPDAGPRRGRALPGIGRSPTARCPASPDGRHRPRSRSSARPIPSTATSPATSRMQARPAVPDGADGDRVGARGRAARAGAGRSGRSAVADRDRRGRAARVPEPATPRRRPWRPRSAAHPRRPARAGAGSRRSARARSTSSSCRPTRPDRSTSATPAARSSATCCAGSSRPAASASRASTTSTTRAARSGTSARRSRALRRGEPVPEDGYHGEYVDDLAAALPDDVLGRRDAPRRRRGRRPRRPLGGGARPRGHRGEPRAGSASASTSGRARRGCTTRAGSSARSSACGSAATSTSRTARSGSARPRSATTRTGSSIRSNGEPTYFAADIGYVTEKFSRGFDHLIYIWGADHHGTVARVRNAAEAMGYDREAVEILLYSWVRFVRDGQEVSMSKRAGEFITLDELLAEVGVDAARWFFASRAATTEHRLRHRAGQEAVEREPGLLRPVRARPDRLDPAQGGGGRAGARRRRSRVRSAGAPGGRAGRERRSLPRGRRGRGRRARRPTASPPTPPSSRRRSTASTATPGSWTPTRPSGRRRGWPWPRPRGSRWRTRSVCSGSPRRTRCRHAGRSGGSGQPGPLSGETQDAATLPSVVGVAGDDDPAGLAARARQHLRRCRPPCRGPSWRRPRTRPRRRRCPRRSARPRPRRRRAVQHGQPVAAPAGRGIGRVPLARRHPRAARCRAGAPRTCPQRTVQPVPSLRREVGRQRHRDRRLACRVLLRDGGSARSIAGILVKTALTAGQPPVLCSRWSLGEARSCTGIDQLSLRIAGVRASTACAAGSLPDASSSEVGLGQVGRRPLGHEQGRVALVDRLPGQQLVALVVRPLRSP